MRISENDDSLGPGGLYPTLRSQEPVGPHGGGYQPPGNYGPPSDGYNPPRSYGYQPGQEKAEEEEAFGGGCLDKVGLALGGLVAAGGVAAALHAMNVSVMKGLPHFLTYVLRLFRKRKPKKRAMRKRMLQRQSQREEVLEVLIYHPLAPPWRAA